MLLLLLEEEEEDLVSYSYNNDSYLQEEEGERVHERKSLAIRRTQIPPRHDTSETTSRLLATDVSSSSSVEDGAVDGTFVV
jgi:hypothetical protein